MICRHCWRSGGLFGISTWSPWNCQTECVQTNSLFFLHSPAPLLSSSFSPSQVFRLRAWDSYPFPGHTFPPPTSNLHPLHQQALSALPSKHIPCLTTSHQPCYHLKSPHHLSPGILQHLPDWSCSWQCFSPQCAHSSLFKILSQILSFPSSFHLTQSKIHNLHNLQVPL